MPQVIFIAGPNGAGKTSFATQYLAALPGAFEFVNADEIARELGPASDIEAGRLMLGRIDELVAARSDFALETTLASLHYARRIPGWRNSGYRVSLFYLRIETEAYAIERVARRKASGGHDVPEAVIRRRFEKSRQYFQQIYKPIVDEWQLWDSIEGDFRRVETWHRTSNR